MRTHLTRLLAGAALTLWCVGGCGASRVPDPSPSDTSPPAVVDVAELGTVEVYAQALFDGTNAARTAEGLVALAQSPCAQAQAGARAQGLADAGGELVHAPMAPVTAACPPGKMSGENLSRAAVRADAVVDAWMQSSGHRENILTADYTDLGVACVVSSVKDVDQLLCSEIFLG